MSTESGQHKWLDKFMPFNLKVKLLNWMQPTSLLAHNLNILQSRASEALRYLKSTRIIKGGAATPLSNLPWYLVIGPKQSGKTNLLARSDINYVREGEALKSDSNAATCEWWITPESVLIDVPGSFTNVSEKKSTLNNETWLYLLELLRKKQFKQNLSGVVFTISVDQLLDDDYREVLVDILHSRDHDIQAVFGRSLPFYFVITKIDTLKGFLEFFGDSSIEDLNQAWGVTMPGTLGADSVSSVFIYRFNALLKVLNSHMLRRLHVERNLQTKSYVKNFPLHVERVKSAFADLLNMLSSQNVNLLLKGVYMTSATQFDRQDVSAAYQAISGAAAKQSVLTHLEVSHIAKHPYFIKQFLLHGIRT